MMNDYLSEIELDRTILYVLNQHKGKENAIKRWEFVEQIFGREAVFEPMRNNNNVWDRQCRDSIERWRSQGQHICNMGDGYYMAESRAEYEEWKSTYLSAVYRKLEITQMMDETADKRWGKAPKPVSPAQVSLFEGMTS